MTSCEAQTIFATDCYAATYTESQCSTTSVTSPNGFRSTTHLGFRFGDSWATGLELVASSNQNTLQTNTGTSGFAGMVCYMDMPTPYPLIDGWDVGNQIR